VYILLAYFVVSVALIFLRIKYKNKKFLYVLLAITIIFLLTFIGITQYVKFQKIKAGEAISKCIKECTKEPCFCYPLEVGC
jgi:hypothetical protein